MNKEELQQYFPIAYEVEAGKEYKWCGCGKSKTQPLCDGNDCTKFVMYHSNLTETVMFCNCKQTKEPPLCDGTHGTILMEHLKRQKG